MTVPASAGRPRGQCDRGGTGHMLMRPGSLLPSFPGPRFFPHTVHSGEWEPALVVQVAELGQASAFSASVFVDSTNFRSKIFGNKIPESSKKQNLNLPHVEHHAECTQRWIGVPCCSLSHFAYPPAPQPLPTLLSPSRLRLCPRQAGNAGFLSTEHVWYFFPSPPFPKQYCLTTICLEFTLYEVL